MAGLNYQITDNAWEMPWLDPNETTNKQKRSLRKVGGGKRVGEKVCSKWVIAKYFLSLKLKKNKGEQMSNFMTRVINLLVFWPQYWYMKNKIGGETVDMNRAFFIQIVKVVK